jgi:uncharacterized membrane protein
MTMPRVTVAGHSAHAIVNDWPIALLTTGFAFDVLHLLRGRKQDAGTAHDLLAVGVLTGAIAAMTGIAEYVAIERKGEIRKYGRIHSMFGSLIMVSAGLSLYLRRKKSPNIRQVVGLSGVAAVATVLSAWYGDEMVFGQEVRVMDRHVRPGSVELRIPGDRWLTETLRHPFAVQ